MWAPWLMLHCETAQCGNRHCLVLFLYTLSQRYITTVVLMKHLSQLVCVFAMEAKVVYRSQWGLAALSVSLEYHIMCMHICITQSITIIATHIYYFKRYANALEYSFLIHNVCTLTIADPLPIRHQSPDSSGHPCKVDVLFKTIQLSCKLN